MDTVGRVKMQCWKSQSPACRKLPCFSSTFSFEMKRKPISLPLLLVSPPSCSLSMSPKVDEEQSDSAILSTAPSESESVLVHVRFVLQKECMFGERFYLVGDDPLFGLWDPSNGIPLDWSDGHTWSAQLDVPMSKKVEFKFVLVRLSGEVQWQPGPNRILLLDQVMTSTKSQASTITVWENWDSAGNQTISMEDDVAVSAEASVMEDEIQVPGPDHTNETRDNPESTLGDTISEIISYTEPDIESNSEGISLVPGLKSETTFPQENDRDSAGNQMISMDDDVAVSAEVSVMEDEIQVSGPDHTNETRDNPESTLGDAISEIISNTKPDKESNSEGISFVPGLKPETTSPQENDWDSAGNQMISMDDDVAVSAEVSVMEDEIQVPGPDHTNETRDNPESTLGDAISEIISNTEPDKESNSEGISLVPGLKPETTFPRENDSVKPLETADGDHSPVNKMTLDDCEDRSYNKGADELSISSEEVNLELTTAGILRNDLQWGQRALQDSTTAGILRNDLQWGRRALQDCISGLGFDFDKT